MKKSNQNNLDFEMINLDETAGWNQLEIEEALAEKTYTEENMMWWAEMDSSPIFNSYQLKANLASSLFLPTSIYTQVINILNHIIDAYIEAHKS